MLLYILLVDCKRNFFETLLKAVNFLPNTLYGNSFSTLLLTQRIYRQIIYNLNIKHNIKHKTCTVFSNIWKKFSYVRHFHKR